jgi:hypothetical protein
MKHVRTVSRVTVSQAMTTAEILSLVATILSGIGGLIAAIGPLVGGK